MSANSVYHRQHAEIRLIPETNVLAPEGRGGCEGTSQ